MNFNYLIAADFGPHGVQFLCFDHSWTHHPKLAWEFETREKANRHLRILNLPPSAQVIMA